MGKTVAILLLILAGPAGCAGVTRARPLPFAPTPLPAVGARQERPGPAAFHIRAASFRLGLGGEPSPTDCDDYRIGLRVELPF